MVSAARYGTALLAMSTACAACGDDDDARTTDAGRDAAIVIDAGDDDGGDASSDRCARIDARRRVEIDADIVADTHWTCADLYVLTGVVFVRAGATLTIDPGVVVHGVEDSVLLVSADGYVVAEGTASEPITFTSAKPIGSRARGDWGGLMLLGRASANPGPDVITLESGPLDERGAFGGDDDEHDCGSLRFVRIQFVGSGQTTGDDLNALTLAGCGRGTRIDFVHAHFVRGDGVEIQGGTVDLRHVIVTRADDDAIDWDSGWRGRAQYVVAQPDPFAADSAIEGDSNFGDAAIEPRSSPTLFNATLLGPDLAGGSQTGAILRSGTRARIANTIVMGFPGETLDVIGDETALDVGPDELALTHSIVFDVGRGGTTWFDPTDDDDGAFDELSYFDDPMLANRFGIDPELPDALDLEAPRWVPERASPVAEDALAPPDDGFFDPDATYVGAFAPGGVDWTEGWAERPES